MVDEVEATKAAETAVAAAAAVAAVAPIHGKSNHARPGATPGAAPKSGTDDAGTTPEALSEPPAAGTERPARGTGEAPVAGRVLDSKRPATSTVTSDPKRRRRSRGSICTMAASSQQGGGGGGGGAIAGSSSGAVDERGANNTGGESGPSRTAAGKASSLELVPHPVFARKEQAVKEVETMTPSAAEVISMARKAQELAERVRACEGKLAVAPSTVGTCRVLCVNTVRIQADKLRPDMIIFLSL